MRCLVLLAVVGLALGLEDIFKCDNETLLRDGLSHFDLTDNQGKGITYFSLGVTNKNGSWADEYKNGEALTVTLKGHKVDREFIKFMIVARPTGITTPRGTWDPSGFAVSSCAGNDASAISTNPLLKAADFKKVTMTYNPPRSTGSRTSLEFVAAVEAIDGKIYYHITSVPLEPSESEHKPVIEPPAEQPAPNPRQPDPHTAPSELEEKKQKPDDEVEGGEDTRDEENVEKEDEENPNEPELIEIEEKRRSDFLDTHGRQDEEAASLKRQREEAEQLEQELAEGEEDWVKERLDMEREVEEDRHKEMMEYERIMAEEEKKRMDMIEWEIKDKEEHDRKMWEEEQKKKEQEKEENKTPKEDHEVEIKVDEEIIIVDKDAGASAATFSYFLLLATAFYLLL